MRIKYLAPALTDADAVMARAKRLAGLIRDMKFGMSAEASLQKNYGMDYAQFETYGRGYVRSLDR